MAKLTLDVTGMSCASCAGRVERALAAVPGVSDPQVNFATGRVTLGADGARLRDLSAALDKAGYPARLHQTELEVSDMSCASCSGRVERALTALPEVAQAEVNLMTGRARVTHSDLDPAILARTVTEAGYPARVLTGDHPAAGPEDESPRLRRAFWLALALTLPVFVAEMGGHLIPGFHGWLSGLIPMRVLWGMEFVLTLLVLAGPGRVFYRHGVPALLRGAPEMNSLVVLGASAAFIYSTVALFAPGLLPQSARHVYFESAAVIVTLILLGRWLEARAKGQAGQAIRRLLDLAPDSASVQREGRFVEVPVAEIRPGDIIRLRPAERVALDGEVMEGQGHIDESMLTGEPLPAPRGPGDPVTGGTINGNVPLIYRVTATGSDTRLAGIVRLVEEAQAGKLPVQALVDRITRVFVPAVIALSVLTFALWMIFAPAPALSQAVVSAIAVLIIACPCAMGLAVPVSILVGTGRGAELGVLFRRGDALQRLAEARIVGFDKTGTLTEGAPRVTATRTRGIAESEALRLAAGLEAGSEHPLARAIIAAAEAEGLSPPDAQNTRALPGRGMSGQVEGRDILAGNSAALTEAGIAPDAELISWAESRAAQGETPVHLAQDGQHIAAMAIADAPRPESGAAIASLHGLGLRTVMISGDVQAAAEAVGASLGIDQVHGGVSPEQKLDRLRDMGPGSVFVGDGINDAPALAGAETGIAMGSGTDVAIEAAEVVLMRPDPRGVATAIALSRAVMRNIRQNLFWAFAYNVVLIPVAMGALVPFGGPQLSPMLGALAMAMSSVFVVSNALRLRRFAA